MAFVRTLPATGIRTAADMEMRLWTCLLCVLLFQQTFRSAISRAHHAAPSPRTTDVAVYTVFNMPCGCDFDSTYTLHVPVHSDSAACHLGNPCRLKRQKPRCERVQFPIRGAQRRRVDGIRSAASVSSSAIAAPGLHASSHLAGTSLYCLLFMTSATCSESPRGGVTASGRFHRPYRLARWPRKGGGAVSEGLAHRHGPPRDSIDQDRILQTRRRPSQGLFVLMEIIADCPARTHRFYVPARKDISSLRCHSPSPRFLLSSIRMLPQIGRVPKTKTKARSGPP
ncbi:hypothetical protein BC628DRAFT_664471 [Trametes gibbosa]|nr:hypothetical protein BC628DRAFT_664471 [Trametes gibbosa]